MCFIHFSVIGAKSSYNVWNDYIYPVKIINAQCHGNETSFTSCQYDISSSSSCYYNYYYGAVAVFCQKSTYAYLCDIEITISFIATIEAPINCTEGEIRLYGGSRPNEGILHMCANGAWGTVCYRYWSNNDANVACYELGYTTYGMSTYFFMPYFILLNTSKIAILKFDVVIHIINDTWLYYFNPFLHY